MSIYFFKTILSFIMLLSAFVNVFTIFEALGRSEPRYNVHTLKRIHRINGAFFIVIFFVITYFCFGSIINGQLELSPRAAFHSVFALAVILLLALKISFIERYGKFGDKILVIGPVIALIALGMIGTSGGYYLLVTRFHTDKTFDEIREYKDKGPPAAAGPKSGAVKSDPESIEKGKETFDAKCGPCHDAHSTNAGVGPGLKGVLKKAKLPASNKPATPENIRSQLQNPFNKMPPFRDFTREEVDNLIAFLQSV